MIVLMCYREFTQRTHPERFRDAKGRKELEQAEGAKLVLVLKYGKSRTN